MCPQNHDLATITSGGRAQTHDGIGLVLTFTYHGWLQYTREKELEVKQEESRAILEFQVRVVDIEKLITLCVMSFWLLARDHTIFERELDVNVRQGHVRRVCVPDWLI